MKDCIAIISGAPLGLAPYIQFYINILKENNVNFIILNVEAKENGKIHENQILFNHDYKPGLMNKIIRLTKGLIYLHQNIRIHKCNKIIVAPTRTGIRLFPYLYLFFKNRYILDIRDFTKEDKKLFKFIEDKLIENSFFSLISSKGFLSFVKDSSKVINVHNLPYKFSTEKYPEIINKSKIIIGSVGMISYFKENNSLIQKLANNPKIHLHFHGIVTDEWNIQEYLERNKHIKNMKFYGEFKNGEKAEIYKSITIINNIYGSDSINAKTLTANRLYDAAIYKKPIIVSSNTYLSKIVEDYGLGITVDVFNDNLELKIMSYIDSFNADKFNANCERFLDDVMNEQSNTINKILEFINC